MGETGATKSAEVDDSVMIVDEPVPVIDLESSPVKSVPEAVKSAASTKSTEPLRGMPKSGRFWKAPKDRASSIKKHKRDSLQKKLKERMDRKTAQEMSHSIRDQFVEQKKAKRERAAENKKRKEENQRKSEIVQKINNTAKIKKMKKKQLRFIEKRDTTNM